MDNGRPIFREKFEIDNWNKDKKWEEQISINRGEGSVKVERNGYLKIQRTGAGQAGGGVGIKKKLKLPVSRSTQIIFDVKADFSDVRNGAGDGGTELPAIISLEIEQSDGKIFYLSFGYNYRGGGKVEGENFLQLCKGNIQQSKWLVGEKYNIKELSPKAKKIVGIWVGGSGWNFESCFDNITIK